MGCGEAMRSDPVGSSHTDPMGSDDPACFGYPVDSGDLATPCDQ